ATQESCGRFAQIAYAASMRPCLEPGCNALAAGPRCPLHSRLRTPEQRAIRNSRQWRRLSAATRRARPLCVDCLAAGRVELAIDVHHEPAGAIGGQLLAVGDQLTPLCKICHGKRTATERARARMLTDLSVTQSLTADAGGYDAMRHGGGGSGIASPASARR